MRKVKWYTDACWESPGSREYIDRTGNGGSYYHLCRRCWTQVESGEIKLEVYNGEPMEGGKWVADDIGYLLEGACCAGCGAEFLDC